MTGYDDTLYVQQNSAAILASWQDSLINPSVILRTLAGTTEDEFLHIGSQMQNFYQRSSDITAMANQLVDAVTGQQIRLLIDRFRQIMADMEIYLSGARSQNHNSCETLERIPVLLEQVSQPLESFRKMTKTLRMLGISTKIESSRLGDMGNGFQTLALDVEKLSELVCQKSVNILEHRHQLSKTIAADLQVVHASETAQNRDVSDILAKTSRNLEELEGVNTRCGTLGNLISSISRDVTANISEVVSSLQMHDMTRQQVEHIVGAVELLSANLRDSTGMASTREIHRKLIIEAGDVCELQSAQLRFATSELSTAVCSIVDNLRDVAAKQASMASEILSTTGLVDSGGGSFMEAMHRGMDTVTAVLTNCAESERGMSATLSHVANTMQEVTGFVTDIESIGSEIGLIALNAQIKAAHTGRDGAALGVLAEAIKRLSVDAIIQTDTVSQILLQINQFTQHLLQEATGGSEQLSRIAAMEKEMSNILLELEHINNALMELLPGLGSMIGALADDIERVTVGIDVHERAQGMAEQVVTCLDTIVAASRELEPASSEFKNNLRHMEEHYTMQSERHIHEAIARKRGGGSFAPSTYIPETEAAACDASEFGANVDLF